MTVIEIITEKLKDSDLNYNFFPKDIIAEWCGENGYEGLYDPDNDDCGCFLDDLFPCGEGGNGCKPGKKLQGTDGEWGIFPEKDEDTEPEGKAKRLPTPQECYEVALKRGKFEGDYPLRNAMNALKSEVMEVDQAHIRGEWRENMPHGIQRELAHVILVCRTIAGILNCDLDKIIIEEHEYNIKRAEEVK